jgi:transposase InsO family protein
MDLFARNIVGWSMSPRVNEDLVLDALTMAYWRRKPDNKAMLLQTRAHSTPAIGARNCLKL